MAKCLICNLQLSDFPNALSLHIRMHDISRIDYYKQYIDSRTTCKACDIELKFKNLSKGYSEYCSSCAQWSGERGDTRRKLHSQRLIDTPMIGGRPKGAKNVNPYPTTDAVLDRYASQVGRPAPHNRNPEKINKCKDTWAKKTDDEIKSIISKRDNTEISRDNSEYIQPTLTTKELLKMNKSMSEIFGVDFLG